MSPEPQNQSMPLPVTTIEEVIFSEEFLLQTDIQGQREYLLEKVN